MFIFDDLSGHILSVLDHNNYCSWKEKNNFAQVFFFFLENFNFSDCFSSEVEFDMFKNINIKL